MGTLTTGEHWRHVQNPQMSVLLVPKLTKGSRSTSVSVAEWMVGFMTSKMTVLPTTSTTVRAGCATARRMAATGDWITTRQLSQNDAISAGTGYAAVLLFDKIKH